jgi:hypothetical protein
MLHFSYTDRDYVDGALSLIVPALATLLYEDWLPQVNGPPRVLQSLNVNHKLICVNKASS